MNSSTRHWIYLPTPFYKMYAPMYPAQRNQHASLRLPPPALGLGPQFFPADPFLRHLGAYR